MTIEKSLKIVCWGMVAVVFLLLLPMVVIGAFNTLFEGGFQIKHNIGTYLSTYLFLVLLCIRVNFNN